MGEFIQVDVENNHIDEEVEQKDGQRRASCSTVPLLSAGLWRRLEMTITLNGPLLTYIERSPGCWQVR